MLALRSRALHTHKASALMCTLSPLIHSYTDNDNVLLLAWLALKYDVFFFAKVPLAFSELQVSPTLEMQTYNLLL